MNATAVTIPYERQSDPESQRACGATCLRMVYRSFGKDAPEAEIWPAIAKENRFGSLASTTHLMTQDALGRGFAAIAVQASNPLLALRVCHKTGMRAILNHRLTPDSPAGHYSVLVDIDDTSVVVHDPFHGPSRRIPHAELLDLWQPRLPGSEIVGYFLIAIAPQPGVAVPTCTLCGTVMPPAVDCPRCQGVVGLQPGAILGCMNAACPAREWNHINCPHCDFTWSFSLDMPAAPPPASKEPNSASATPLDFDHVFSELNKFSSHVLSLPAVANNEQIKSQIAFIGESIERFKLARTERLAHERLLQEQQAAQAQAAQLTEEAYRKRREELAAASPPLDGNALGRALLANLGFAP